MGSRVPAPRRGLGEGREQNPRLLRGSGEGLHSPRADASSARSLPQGSRENEDPLGRQPSAAPRGLPTRSSPLARTHVCSPRGARELSPHARRRSLQTPLLPPGAGRGCRVAAASGAGRPAGTAREGSGGGSHRTPAGAPRDRPGQGWAPESNPRRSAAPRFRGSWGIPSPRRESGD